MSNTNDSTALIHKQDIRDLSKEDKELLAKLASSTLGKKEDELTDTDIIYIMEMELAALPMELSVSVEETRRTQLQFCNTRYGAEMKIDLSELKMVVKEIIYNHENSFEGFIKASQMIKSFVQAKYERSELFLRTMANEAIKKDGLEMIPGTRCSKGSA